MAGVNGGARLLDQAPVAVVLTDRKGTIALWNRSAEGLFGWTAPEVLGRKIFALALPNGDELLGDALGLATAGDTWRGELVLCDRGGRRRPVHLSASPLSDLSGQNVGAMVVLLDAQSMRGGDRALATECGARIAQARKQAGLTQQALADGLAVTRRSIQGYEAGAVVPYKHLGRLAELLGRPSAWFLTGEPAGSAEPEQSEALRTELRQVLHEELAAIFAVLGVTPDQLERIKRSTGRRDDPGRIDSRAA